MSSSNSTSSSTTLARELGEAGEIETSFREEQRRAAHREAQRRYREARAVGETTVQRQQRLKKNKECATKRRASEKSESTTLRLTKERLRRRSSRSKETSDQKQIRLASMREAAKNRVQLEGETSKQVRLEAKRARAKQSHANMTDLQRETRLAAMRARAQNQREQETEHERVARLEEMRLQARERVNCETEYEREARLADMRIRAQDRVNNEIEYEREARLADMRIRAQDRVTNETEQERETRIADMRARAQDRINNESEHEREARLADMRVRAQDRVNNESEHEREARLADMRIRAQERHQRQSIEERETMLSEVTMHAQQRLCLENQTDREDRLSNMRIYARQYTRQSSIIEQPILEKLTTFHNKLASYDFQQCPHCNESFPVISPNSTLMECTHCKKDKHQPKLYSHENNMDPGNVPGQLQGLTQVEELLIAAVVPMMSVYRLPHGQYGYSGHVLNLPQDVSSFASRLPRTPSELDIVLVRKEGESGSHKDFKVRRSKVLHALQWLRENNKYYRSIDIDDIALQQLPEDGNLVHSVPTIHDEEPDGSQITNEHSQNHSNEDPMDPYSSFLYGTFVPSTQQRLTEEQIVRKSIVDRQSHQNSTCILTWPQIGCIPINEFQTEGYMSCAFPTLFPTGAADFAAPRLRPITIGNYFKHLIVYKDGRFAKHPRFRYFALNTEMRWRALQAGRIYVRQHLDDARLSAEELRDMVGTVGETFSKRVQHFATSLRGTNAYWFKQRNRLTAMVDTLGLPTVFFTHSAADMQWPELAHLICPHNPSDKNCRKQAVIENPAIADWFFYQRIQLFLKYFYKEILHAKDYWLRFEWQHRGSPHVHGLAWLQGAPDIEGAFASGPVDDETKHTFVKYIDSIVCTMNPSILPDGSNASNAPPPQTNPHACNKPFNDVTDYNLDLSQLIATCQRHTVCSEAYCLKQKNGQQSCRFGYPKELQSETVITTSECGDIELVTIRNDPLVNSFNPVQLSAWRANVDMQYCLSRSKVINYCAKYATKSEPRSQSLKEVYKNTIKGIGDQDKSLKVIQKLLINTVGGRDYSAQETCHLLLQLPLYMASRDFVILGTDGMRAVENSLDDESPATALSILDHYRTRPTTSQYSEMTLLHFAQNYTTCMSQTDSEPKHRNKTVVVIVKPHYSPDPNGNSYEQYCRQKLMLHKPFRELSELLTGHASHADAYADYLQSGNVPPCLQDDIYRLQQQEMNNQHQQTQDETTILRHNSRQIEEWMILCQQNLQIEENENNPDTHFSWLAAARAYPNLSEAPTFISRNKESITITLPTSADPQLLQGTQLKAYQTVLQHFSQGVTEPLRVIITGTAGTGKSFLIACLKQLLSHKVVVTAPTGVAAFNVQGCTLHSLLQLPTKGEFKDLEGESLHKIQQSLKEVQYIIIDEMSMVGRKMFGQIDKRLRQAFPSCANHIFGGCSCLLFGDFGQLPPVFDLPLYTNNQSSNLSDLGRTAYMSFTKAIVLTHVMRQTGEDPQQVAFRDILLRLRNAKVTQDDWEHMMTRTSSNVSNLQDFKNAIHLYPTVEAVAEHNLIKLKQNNQPIAMIKAVHSGHNAAKGSSEDAGGLEPVLHLAHNARVMLISNLWVEAGLVNGAMGTVKAICYTTGEPPTLPTAVMVTFDSYSGPTLSDGTVPIVPIRRTWGQSCSRLQLPLKLAWAITIHKSQGLTLDKAVINIGKKEFSTGLTFVACSRLRQITDLVFHPGFDYQRLANLSNSSRLTERRAEDIRLHSLFHWSNVCSTFTSI